MKKVLSALVLVSLVQTNAMAFSPVKSAKDAANRASGLVKASFKAGRNVADLSTQFVKRELRLAEQLVKFHVSVSEAVAKDGLDIADGLVKESVSAVKGH
jgi:hypothetical protein